MTSFLFKLPAELRNMIWNYALTSDTGTLQYNPSTKRFDVSHIGAGLLTTCRSISIETLYTPVRLNTLVFDTGIVGDVDLWVLLARLGRLDQATQYGLRLDLRIRKPHPSTLAQKPSTNRTPKSPGAPNAVRVTSYRRS
ncbi:hypothetical protein BU25DRAFT_420128 [Macroventuria anomochaeta]|uniref:Uncharacterized protein n=1 Tax=Macroventuria anomochaeta TaxID=301207 RepID=A0ACB6S4T3_9PLEO|nr:uncharacterized protein BU25DRAFT_420128 [Macroventuria anomochaeta]KAF2629250.1 hypothetical protein BU25DRAFT_420128 [Macroventuria anomochaeta]